MLPPLTGIAGLNPEKEIHRQRLKLERKAAYKARPDAARFAASHFLAAPFFSSLKSDGVVALYHPIAEELDTEPLFDALCARSVRIALPVTPRGKAPLIFYPFAMGDALIAGRHGVLAPERRETPVDPDIVVAPLLGFTADGARLGYGGGYYDRTLAALRERSAPVFVGYAYGAQEVDALPIGPLDQRLDWVVTERGARSCR